MSMSLFVILALGSTPDTDSLNKYASEMKVPIEYVHPADLKDHSGYLPVKLEGATSGFETYFDSYESLKSYLPPKEITFEDPVAIQFRWGSDAKEGSAVFYAAAIMSQKLRAIAFDAEGGRYMSTEELLSAAKMLAGMER